MDYGDLPRTQLEKEAVSLLLALGDLDTALTTLGVLLDREPPEWNLMDHRDRRLAEISVVIYARPFAKGPTMLNKSRWPGYARASWTTQHERYVRLRHEFLAHSGGVEELRISAGDGGDWRLSFNRPFLHAPDMMVARPMFEDLRERLVDEGDKAVRALVASEHAQTATWPVEISLRPPPR